MKILKIYTIEPIQSLGMDSSFTFDKIYSNGQSYPIKYDGELKVIRINNTLIPLSNIKEIVLEQEEVIVEPKIIEPKPTVKKGK